MAIIVPDGKKAIVIWTRGSNRDRVILFVPATLEIKKEITLQVGQDGVLVAYAFFGTKILWNKEQFQLDYRSPNDYISPMGRFPRWVGTLID